jgi:hypothetical protein
VERITWLLFEKLKKEGFMSGRGSRVPRVTVLITLTIFLSGSLLFPEELPAPEEFLGFEIGADYHLATYEQAIDYLRLLEEASPMIKLFEMGKTAREKPMFYAVISSAENMDKLDRLKEISRRLALVKGLTDEEARRLAAEGRAVVYISGGLHASEVAPPQQNMQLAYDLLSSEDSDTRLIRDNVIFLLAFPNPDGMDMIAEWYLSNVGTPYEISPMPWLYTEYVGHDNNRDSFMNNSIEVQNITRLVSKEWYPVVFYDHHQTAPFPARIWIPPFAEPTNPNVHPLTIRGQNLIGTAMGAAFERNGQVGAISRIRFSGGYPGHVTCAAEYQNTISVMTETALYRYATPHFYTVEDFPEDSRDFTRSFFYPTPWKGGWWRLRDAVEYCLTASKAVLHTAALYREKFLYGKYQMGKDNINRFQEQPPYAWIIPQAQWDAPTAAVLLNKMILLGIEVYKAEESFDSDGISYPAGTWVIPMSQPFALFVKTLFEEQRLPDLTDYPALWQGVVRPQKFADAFLPPYDDAGFTLPYKMGVRVKAAHSPVDVRLSPLETVVAPAGKVEGAAGYAFLVSPKTNNSFIAVNRIIENGGDVLWARESFSVGGKSYPPGTFIVPAKSTSRSFVESLAKELFLDIDGTGSQAKTETYRLKSPRVALYKPWTASMDEGWTRWLLEQFEFPFTNVYDAEVRAGELGEKFDIFVIASMSTDSVVNGHKPGTVPPKYEGGITPTGVSNIKKFVEEGGTLVLLNQASLFAIDRLGVPVQNVLKDVTAPRRRSRETPEARRVEFACPGSILRMNFDSKHPVAYGMPDQGGGFFVRSPGFDVLASFEGNTPTVIARYPGGNLLMSGFLKGDKYLQNRASAVDVPYGRGRVLMLGFGLQHRGQPHGTFKLLFNSLYYGVAR